jgi:hypothetical protein
MVIKGLLGQTGSEFSAYDIEDPVGENSKTHVEFKLKLDYQGSEEDKPI